MWVRCARAREPGPLRECSVHISLASKIVALDCNWILNKQLSAANGIDARWLLCENVRMIKWVAMQTKCTPCRDIPHAPFSRLRSALWKCDVDFQSRLWLVLMENYFEIKMSRMSTSSHGVEFFFVEPRDHRSDQLRICSKKSHLRSSATLHRCISVGWQFRCSDFDMERCTSDFFLTLQRRRCLLYCDYIKWQYVW